MNNSGIKEFDALHIACAIEAECDYFITTDDGYDEFKKTNRYILLSQ